jgi:aminoglycoside 6'-N-acetyltransferase
MTAPGNPSPNGQAAYDFRPMSAHDLEMVNVWLGRPHVCEWWGDPGEQLELVSADLAEPVMDPFIVSRRGRPFAYLQGYLQSAWPENGLGAHPPGTRGIDQFIGEPDMVGRGHGSAFIRTFVDGLLAAGVPRGCHRSRPGQCARDPGLQQSWLPRARPRGYARRPCPSHDARQSGNGVNGHAA